MIEREDIEEMFADIRTQGKWNLDGPLLWGYFFTAGTKQKLEPAGKALTKDGYRFVDIWLSESDEPDEPDCWWLHVERVEHHTVDSLHKRNKLLEAVAKKFDVDYDGMDVGLVEE
jgi:hypothetical protein